MNPNTETERTNKTAASPSRKQGLRYQTAAMVAIILIAILASAASAYSTTLPTSPLTANQGRASIVQVNATVSPTVSVAVSVGSTQTQMPSTQTTVSMTSQSMSTQSSSQTMTTVQGSSSITTQTMTTTSVAQQYCGYGCYYPYHGNPPYYPSYPGYYPSYPAYPSYAYGYGACGYGTTYSGNVQCTGYIYQAPNGCVELVLQIVNPYSYTSALQYYTLHNLSSTPPSGTLVTVNGQMHQGYNTSTTGAACPGNYINVNSITTA